MDGLRGKIREQTGAAEFDRWWQHPGAWVEPPNQRRGGESGVQLLPRRDPARAPMYCKRQTGHLYRTLLHPFGLPTILRELQAYRALLRIGIKTPRLIYGAARRQRGQWQALLVTEALQDFISLEQWYAGNPGAMLTQAMLRQLAATLARLHLAGWQHGCCYPKHIFVKTSPGDCDAPSVEIALLDLEKSRRRWRTGKASQHDLSQLARHRGNMPAGDLLFLHEAYRLAVGGRRLSAAANAGGFAGQFMGSAPPRVAALADDSAAPDGLPLRAAHAGLGIPRGD